MDRLLQAVLCRVIRRGAPHVAAAPQSIFSVLFDAVYGGRGAPGEAGHTQFTRATIEIGCGRHT